MIQNRYQPGEKFPIQFVWQTPDGDYLRAVFEAEILHLIQPSQRYALKLGKWIAARHETPNGELRPVEEAMGGYWELVDQLTGSIIEVAYEADDSRALHLRLETLTGEHHYFTKLSESILEDS